MFIGKETYPLFLSADVTHEPAVEVTWPAPLFGVGQDPYLEVVYAVGAQGIGFVNRFDGSEIARHDVSALQQTRITSVDPTPRDGYVAMGLADGRVTAVRVEFDLLYEGDERTVLPKVRGEQTIELFDGVAVQRLAWRDDGDRRSVLAAESADGDFVVRVAERTRSLLGPGRLQQALFPLRVDGPITALALDRAARHLAIASETGSVAIWRIRGIDDEPELLQSFRAGAGQQATAMAFLLGDLSLALGTDKGAVSVWFQVDREEGRRFHRVHDLDGHDSAVTAIVPSQRDKQFLTGDAAGRVALHHATSEQTFFQIDGHGGAVRGLTFAPKADGFLTIAGQAGRIGVHLLDNPHPEVTISTLFGRIWYEGYGEPEYVWQSTGGTDEFEPKLSLVPLIFGTMKGTIYAMLFALPMAVLAALYTSEFAPVRVRNTVKPTVEIMASLPSVILGFLAGLWLAPLLENYIVGTALLLLIVPFVTIAGSLVFRQLPRDVRLLLPRNVELVILVALTLASSAAALSLGPPLERAMFDGGLPRWLSDGSGLRYDQRNSLVIGFTMGFAVIPLVFTICEDALSSVPASLRAASLGLGATRWQTAIRVVLPMALPGVFSAAMIGFGRAVGETMIVLMATGNTPILEWNVFTGMRTISANIAVELPEAPHHGTLYRVLFLSGLLLFVVTFALNTVAEGVRQRLREKYRNV